MQNYFNSNIKPLVDTLDKLKGTTHLNITQIEDEDGETQISVWVDDFCNHAGAEYMDVPSACFDKDSHQWINDDSERRLVCENCDAQLIGDEWV